MTRSEPVWQGAARQSTAERLEEGAGQQASVAVDVCNRIPRFEFFPFLDNGFVNRDSGGMLVFYLCFGFSSDFAYLEI
jgi:hypothetical protein